MISTLARRLSPAGPNARLSVLILHRVLPEPDPLFPGEVDARFFDAMCGWVARWFNVLPLDQAVRDLTLGRLSARALAITFDDGYADNHDVALPILQRHRLNATFFVATGFLDGGRMWNDTIIESVRRTRLKALDIQGICDERPGPLPLATPVEKRTAIDALLRDLKYRPAVERESLVQAIADRTGAALPDDLMMTSRQICRLREAGMVIGAHTVSHPILARLDSGSARRELAESKQALERLLAERVGLFAYPNGKPNQDYALEHTVMARDAGFDAAVSTGWGAACQGTDLFQLPRFTPWDRSRWRFGARLISNLLRPQH
jgi:peptidoglycan/xylan/chitin deacetylase (PgdA/CDA1 family)